MSNRDGCKVYGNQHGTYIRLEGELLDKVTRASASLGMTVEQFVIAAIEEKAMMVLVGSPSRR